MNRRLTYIRVILPLLLFTALVWSCGGGQRTESESGQTVVESDGPVSHSEMLAAIPSDAAAVLCFHNSKEGLSVLTDGTNCFSTLVSGNFQKLRHEAQERRCLEIPADGHIASFRGDA